MSILPETIKAAAIKCRYCQSDLREIEAGDQAIANSGDSDLLAALAAGMDPLDIALSTAEVMATEEFRDGDGGVEVELGNVRIQPGADEHGVDGIWVIGSLMNRSHRLLDVEFTLTFTTQHGAHLHESTNSAGSWFPAWTDTDWWFRWETHAEPWVASVAFVDVGGIVVATEPDPHAAARLAAYEATLPVPTIPIETWRGRKYITKLPLLAARCTECGHRFEEQGDAMNALARLTGPLSSVIGFATVIESASMSRRQQNRRIAAGNELERRERDLANAVVSVVCPSCGGAEVLVQEPRS